MYILYCTVYSSILVCLAITGKNMEPGNFVLYEYSNYMGPARLVRPSQPLERGDSEATPDVHNGNALNRGVWAHSLGAMCQSIPRFYSPDYKLI